MDTSITRVLAGTLLLVGSIAACSGDDAGGVTTAPTSSPPTTTTTPSASTTTSPPPPTTAFDTTTAAPATTTSTPVPGWTLPLVCEGACNPPVDVLFTVPVGDAGVTYANVDREEIVGSGPGAFAVDDAGRVWIIDEVDRQLLGFTLDGSPVATVDLTAYEVASAIDIAAGSDGLLLLDVDVATKRYRVLQLDLDGELVTQFELPSGVRLEDGLTGIAAGPGGLVWLELEFGNRVAALDVTGGSVEFSINPGYPYPAGLYGPVVGDTFAYKAAGVVVTVATDSELGGLSLLGVNPDGSFVLLLDEVNADDAGAFRVDQSVHLFDATGNHLGDSVFPLADQFVEVFHALTVGPDGNTYALLTRPDHVAVALLPYSR